jgi:peptidoglycan/xylan/chitin deacetylase (PgdA/CDA1 family)
VPSPYPIKAALTRTRSVAWVARTRGRPDDSGLRILLYHRVANDGDPLAIAPARFRQQMDFLAADGYRVVDVVEALEMLDRGAVPPRTLGLSFDDGFADVRDEELPVLAAHHFTATVSSRLA